MKELTGGRAVIETLKRQGVEIVFGIPGTHNLPIYDALHGDAVGIKHVTTRHEQSAVFMADSYARVTGKPGVALLSTGPGAASALAAAQEAYGSSSPVLLIASQIESELIDQGRGALHEVRDQLGLFERVTAWSRRITRADEIAFSIREAFDYMKAQRPRPAYLEIPTDLLETSETIDLAPEGPTCIGPPSGDEYDVDAACGLLWQAEAPLIYAGGGVIRSNACAHLRVLAEQLEAPVLTSVSGKGAFPEDHYLGLGNLGPEDEVRDWILKTCDLVLAIGTRFSNRSTGRWTLRLPRDLIQIDIEEGQIGKNKDKLGYELKLGIIGDAKIVLSRLLLRSTGVPTCQQLLRSAGVADRPRPSRFNQLQALKTRVHRRLAEQYPREMQILDDIRSSLERDAIICNDSTIVTYWTRRYFPVYEPRTFLWAMGSGTMGFGMPAAIGAKLAKPERQVVAICGEIGRAHV